MSQHEVNLTEDMLKQDRAHKTDSKILLRPKHIRTLSLYGHLWGMNKSGL